MNLLGEHAHGAFRIRITDCGCGQPGCDAIFVFSTVHEVLWLATGICPSPAAADEQARMMLADAAIASMVAQGVGLLGLTWPMLMTSRERVLEQMRAFDACPQWLMGVPVRDVWACRRVVFGDDLTRVPRALEALGAAYVVEGPVRRGELS